MWFRKGYGGGSNKHGNESLVSRKRRKFPVTINFSKLDSFTYLSKLLILNSLFILFLSSVQAVAFQITVIQATFLNMYGTEGRYTHMKCQVNNAFELFISFGIYRNIVRYKSI